MADFSIYVDGQYIDVTEDIYNRYNEDKEQFIFDGYRFVENPNYPEILRQRREDAFNREFFNTSLGYIRRSVTMQDGTHKDFLSDLLPIISIGVQSGQTVNIIAYTMPDFTEDVTDWEQYQRIQVVTPQFVQECFLQLQNDFIPLT